ncbi:MarR family winged helix-turn-helix transcriptional regulator [Leptolyngbya sp. FACHB-261]|uniref:MarR family winged helix-turn-helix transcriptional regulator n=1 Tax=Leptolyngbya sp. FACHB-261 TaxID=2692806 RepID=UPI0016866C37|nr:MarR family transcriptional regulator [Leptolyngbya sp. FACHB-261]MBD2101646.1 MarR family transcriptional regulator [Leptolyngbya sp. FACHB-261]
MTPEQCAAQLMDAIPSAMQFIRAEMRSQSISLLSVPQFRVLAYLRRHPDSSLSEVAEHIGVTRATASTTTERLVQRGFISRVEDPKERRHVMLNLTEMGSTHLQQSREATLHKIAALLTALPHDQLASLSEGLVVLHQLFEAIISESNDAP